MRRVYGGNLKSTESKRNSFTEFSKGRDSRQMALLNPIHPLCVSALQCLLHMRMEATNLLDRHCIPSLWSCNLKNNKEPNSHEVKSRGLRALQAAQQVAQQMHSEPTSLRADQKIKSDDDQFTHGAPDYGKESLDEALKQFGAKPWPPLLIHLAEMIKFVNE